MSIHHAEQVTRLAREHGQLVYRTAYRVLGNAQDAEDVLQEVFLKLLNTLERLDEVREWGAYLRVVASRAALDILRKNSRRRLHSQGDRDSIQTAPAPSEQNPDHRLDAMQQAEIFRRALATLPEREARVFVLRVFEDLAYGEIARLMDLSESQVGVILHRTKDLLRIQLEPHMKDRMSSASFLNPGKENRHV